MQIRDAEGRQLSPGGTKAIMSVLKLTIDFKHRYKYGRVYRFIWIQIPVTGRNAGNHEGPGVAPEAVLQQARQLAVPENQTNHQRSSMFCEKELTRFLLSVK